MQFRENFQTSDIYTSEVKKMAFPLNHKTVFVLDHSPFFSMAADVVQLDTIKLSQPLQYPKALPPVTKTMWTAATESMMEYCRVVWDIFPPDTPEQKLIRFVVSEAKGNCSVINRWSATEQSTGFVSARLAKSGRPEPESRMKMAQSKGYDISRGIETGFKVLSESTEAQLDCQSSMMMNKGRLVVLSHFRDNEHLQEVLENLKTDFGEINQVASSSEVVSVISQVEVHVVHCYTQDICNINPDAVRVQMPTTIDCKVFTVRALDELPKKMMSLALKHFNLASTTVTGIPMKEEQNASSSAIYEVELFHKASSDSKIMTSDTEKDVTQSHKEGFEYVTTTLKWCTPRSSASDLHNCSEIARVSPIDVNSRHSSCLTNFLLNGRSVMLEMPSKKSGYKTMSHMLTSHGGEIFIHTLNISRSILEDPPSISEGEDDSLSSS